MKVVIDSRDEKFVKDFIPQILKTYVINRYSLGRAKKLNDYLLTLGISSNVRTILLYAIDTLRVTISPEGYTVEVDKNRLYPGSNMNLDVLIKLITYGTVDIKGYNIMSSAFTYILSKLTTLKKIYAARTKKKGG